MSKAPPVVGKLLGAAYERVFPGWSASARRLFVYDPDAVSHRRGYTSGSPVGDKYSSCIELTGEVDIDVHRTRSYRPEHQLDSVPFLQDLRYDPPQPYDDANRPSGPAAPAAPVASRREAPALARRPRRRRPPRRRRGVARARTLAARAPGGRPAGAPRRPHAARRGTLCRRRAGLRGRIKLEQQQTCR